MPEEPADGPVLLTPGPVTTSAATKQAMLRDLGLNEPAFLELSAEIRRRAVEIAGGGDDLTAVLLQGTGNAANEATLGTLVPRDHKLLVVKNGFYGERLDAIARGIGLDVETLELSVTEPARPERIEAELTADPAIGHVVVCHVDTGTGLLNPIEAIAEVTRRRRVGLIVDAVASFGGHPLDGTALDAEAIVASPNKWLEGVPGLAMVVVKRAALERAEGRCHSYVLDLFRQWRTFETSGRWRFTPPIQATAALAAALRQYDAEGRAARLARVRANWRVLVEGLRAQGFETVLSDEVSSPVIATFHEPAHPCYERETFFRLMRCRGFVMFRGCLTRAPTFRIGCMGAIDRNVMDRVVGAVGASMAEMGVTDCRPAAGRVAAA